MSKIVWCANAKSHVGSIRAENEDAFLSASVNGLWCVADGMGGHSQGSHASSLIVARLEALISDTQEVSLANIKATIQDANTELFELATTTGQTIGSTVALLFIEENTAHLLWAGDSRIYRMRKNTLSQLTKDHTQAEELIKHGFLARDKAAEHPGSNLVTRAVGTRNRLNLEYKKLECDRSDRFLVCSDGLTDAMNDQEIEATWQKSEPMLVSERLIESALSFWAKDNVTVVCVNG